MAKILAKRLAAAALSAVMAFMAAAVTDGTAVRAASKEGAYVSLRTAYKTLKVGQTNRMTLKNNTLGWKITKIATEDRTVAMVYKKSASGFMIKGKSAGKTKVKARLRADRKKYNSKLVKCTVNVVADSQPVPVAETAKSVATQAELDAALAAGSLTEITIDTKEKQKFVIKEGDCSNVIPVMSKRNGDGYKFSGWYYADGKDGSGNTKYTKFDLINTGITRNLTLYPRWGMTEADRVLDIRGKLYITSGSAIKADLSRSNVTAAIGNDDERAAEFVKIGDTAITASAGEAEVSVKDGTDGKLEIMIQLKDRSRRFRTEIPLPAGAETEINLTECEWSMFNGESINVKNQEQLNAALADRSYSTISIEITTPGAVLMIGAENRQDVKLYVHAAGAKITNNAVFNEIYFEADDITWTENAKGNQLHVLYGTSSVTVAKGAEAASVIFDWGGEGSLIAEGTVKNISLWNDRKPEDTKSVKITVSGTSAVNIPCGIYRSDAEVTASLPLDVTVFDTAPRTVVNFEAGSGNSTVTAYVKAEINNHSGQEIIFKESGK